ncbi:MAG: VWA domain-containing protein [Acidobacteria bacterium]|nr:VWA domain-containing protein [Acidobacteriota bacterium]
MTTVSPQAEQPVRLESSLIQLNVFVATKGGDAVTDLLREDFEILENGKPQRISGFGLEVFDVAFQAPAGPAAATSAATLSESRGQDRSIVILVDDLHIGLENMSQVKAALLGFITYEVRDDDQVAIVSTSGSLGFLQQFTTDRTVMRLALDRLSHRPIGGVGPADRPIRSVYHAELVLRNDREVVEAAIAEVLSENPGLRPDQAERIVIDSARRVSQQADHVAVATIDTISNALRNLQKLEGTKLAMLVSDGFVLSTVNNQARDRLLKVIDGATRASVVVNTIDSRGLVTDGADASVSSGSFTPQQQNVAHRLSSGDRLSRQDTLVTLAHETGGTAFVNNNDLQTGLQSVLRKNNACYALAYLADLGPGKSKDEFRKIEVRVKARPELVIRFQRGFTIPSALAKKKDLREKSESTPKDQIREALGSIAPVRDVGVIARTNFISMADKGALAITGVLIDAKSLTLKPEDKTHKGQIELVGLYYNQEGERVHDFSKSVMLNLRPETYEGVLQDGLRYVDYWHPPPGLYQIRIAVRDGGSGKVGTTAQWLEVPDLTARPLALSDIFFLNELQRPENPEATAEINPPGTPTAPPPIDPRLLVPAWRQFDRNDWINFAFFVYHRPDQEKNEYVVQVQLMRNNTPVFTSPLRLISSGERVDPERIFYGSRVSLEGLNPGKYFLQVIVINRTSRERALGRIDFSVTS